jgi:hypothetical protein
LFSGLAGQLVDDGEVRGRELGAIMHGLQEQWFRDDCQFDLVAAWEAAICRIVPLGDVEILRAEARRLEQSEV